MENAMEAAVFEELDEYIRRQNAADVQGVLELLHRDSLAFDASQDVLLDLFSRFRLRFTLTGRRMLAFDGEYAYARVGVRTERIEGADFRDNLTESLVIFRRSGEEWRIWSQAPIEVRLL